jgi:uncharacterized LabA/DUF88 family protein
MRAKSAPEPAVKRVVAFFDGRNLRKSARSAFGDREYENIHPLKIARLICARQGWQLEGVRFYIGVPGKGRKVAGETRQDWLDRAALWADEGVTVYTRDMTCNNREKGIDVRIALDVARHMQDDEFEVALIFSQDQDFREVVDEVHRVASEENRWLKVASAYPARFDDKNNRGIDGADFGIALDRGTVARCLEPWIGRPSPTDQIKHHLLHFSLRLPRFSFRGTTQWAFGTAAALYLAALIGTFGYLTYSDIAYTAQTSPDQTKTTEAVMIASGTVIMKVPPNAGNAVLWPYYWSDTVAEQIAAFRR